MAEGLDPGLFDFSSLFDFSTALDAPQTADYAAALPDFSASLQAPAAADYAGALGKAAPAAAGNWWSGLVGNESPLTAFSKALGIGSTGVNIAQQMNLGSQTAQAAKGVQRAQKQAQTAAAPAVAFGTQSLQAAQQGQLPAPMQAAVEQWIQQAKAAIRQKYASMGLTGSSDLQREESNIDLMAQAMIAQLLQQQEGTALQGLQTGVSAAVGGGELAQQQQQMLATLIQSANQQLGHLGASA